MGHLITSNNGNADSSKKKPHGGLHPTAPSSETSSPEQAVQTVAPIPEEKVLEAHARHSPPPVENLPAAHKKQVEAPVPPFVDVPAAHVVG